MRNVKTKNNFFFLFVWMSYCLLFIQTGLIEKWLPTAFFSFPLALDWAKMTSLCIPVIIYITLPPFLLKF